MVKKLKYYIWSWLKLIVYDEFENLVNLNDKEFRKSSRMIFKYNEVRNQLKNDINIISGSDFKDVKEYR